MKFYTLYIVNSETGSAREMILKAKTSEHARSLFERFIMKKHETAFAIYPTEVI